MNPKWPFVDLNYSTDFTVFSVDRRIDFFDERSSLANLVKLPEASGGKTAG